MKFTRALFKRKITWVILIAIVAGGYWWHRVSATKNVTPHYVTTKVERGTLMVSVSGSGQVSASNQLDLKPKASGAVVYIGVNNGQIIKAGTLVAQLDTRDAGKTVRDALASLQSTQISLDKLKKSADGLSVLQAQNALEQARESKQQAADSLKKSYEDGFNTIANVFLDLPSIITGMDTILYDETFDKSMWNIDWYTNQGVSYSYENYGKILSYKNDVIKIYTDAKHLYNDSFDAYKAASRASDTSTIETLLRSLK